MGKPAIEIDNLGKQYKIGLREEAVKNFREALVGLLAAPIKRLRRLREKSASGADLFWALRDFSLEVQPSEVIGIIGRNGAGKSTLLKILSRITEPTTGEAVLRGRVSSLLEVGTGFHRELTGRENIYLNGAILGMKKAEIDGKFDEIVAFAEIEKFVDTPVKRYSSGMYVRLAFAVAAHLEPEILIIDEVLAVGDIAFQKKCLGKMSEAAKSGRTVLFVSHNMAAIRSLCSRTVLLDKGVKIAEDVTENVVSLYMSSNTSALSESAELPPGEPDAAGRGVRLRFFNAAGEPGSQFRLGEPWTIRLEFEMLKPSEHVVAAVGLTRFDSTSIITYFSEPKKLEPGRYCVDFLCELTLKPSNIQFNVGLSSYHRPVYYETNLGHVSITQIATGKQPIVADGGIFFAPHKSEIVPL